MPTLIHPLSSPNAAVDPEHVEDALVRISPKWTTWVAQTLAQQGGPMRVRDIAARLPFISGPARRQAAHPDARRRLVTHTDRRQGSPYQLSALGKALPPVHRVLANWSRKHLALGPMAAAERVEDALQRLQLRHSTAVIHALHAHGPMRFVHLAEQAGLTTNAGARLLRLQNDGLVTRGGPRHGDPYTLTDAGAALVPVYTAISDWSTSTAAPQWSVGTPLMATTRAQSEAMSAPPGVLTAAALRRSTAVSGGLFSHAPQRQPQVPAAAPARSTPVHGR